jgi:hypothetical protein
VRQSLIVPDRGQTRGGGTIRLAAYCFVEFGSSGVCKMSDEARPPFDDENFDTPAEAQSSAGATVENIKKTAAGIGAAYDRARQPGMPLSILSNIAREAPLGSLLAAFLLGMAFARRR